MALPLIVTTAGRAAIAALGGTDAVTITEVGVSASAIVASEATAVLTDEIKRVATIAGTPVAADQIHLTVRDVTDDDYTLRSFALYLDDGTLFAAYGQADPIMEKTAPVVMVLGIDIVLADIDAGDITFGDLDFVLPPATETVQGVVELATEAETLTGTDTERAVTPASLAAALEILATAAATNPHSTQLGEGRIFHIKVPESEYYKYPNGQALPLPDYQDLADVLAVAALAGDPFIAADAGVKAANPGLWLLTETEILMPDMKGQFTRIWHDDLVDGVIRPALGRRKNNQNKEHKHQVDTQDSNAENSNAATYEFVRHYNAGDRHVDSSYEGGDEAVPDHTAIWYLIRVL